VPAEDSPLRSRSNNWRSDDHRAARDERSGADPRESAGAIRFLVGFVERSWVAAEISLGQAIRALGGLVGTSIRTQGEQARHAGSAKSGDSDAAQNPRCGAQPRFALGRSRLLMFRQRSTGLPGAIRQVGNGDRPGIRGTARLRGRCRRTRDQRYGPGSAPAAALANRGTFDGGFRS
jgi:hypothetical protein